MQLYAVAWSRSWRLGAGWCRSFARWASWCWFDRLKGILLGYLTTRAYDTVQVRCGSPALERRVRGIVERLGGGQMIEVSGA